MGRHPPGAPQPEARAGSMAAAKIARRIAANIAKLAEMAALIAGWRGNPSVESALLRAKNGMPSSSRRTAGPAGFLKSTATETGYTRLSRPGVALDTPTIHNLKILENFNGRMTWLISTGELPSSRVLRAA